MSLPLPSFPLYIYLLHKVSLSTFSCRSAAARAVYSHHSLQWAVPLHRASCRSAELESGFLKKAKETISKLYDNYPRVFQSQAEGILTGCSPKVYTSSVNKEELSNEFFQFLSSDRWKSFYEGVKSYKSIKKCINKGYCFQLVTLGGKLEEVYQTQI